MLSIEDFSEVVYILRDHEGTLQTDYDDFSMETKLNLTCFGLMFGKLMLDDKYFFNTFWGLTPHWDNKHNNAIYAESPGVYTYEKILSLGKLK